MSESQQHLPYRDVKPQGSAHFYSGINSTFRFVLQRCGMAGWIGYLEEMARGYFAPANRIWQAGGLPAVAAYWREFFAAEPGAEVDVRETQETVALQVRVCPAIAFLREHHRDIVKEYCRHCYHLGQARAEAAGMAMRLQGGDGSCVHTYYADPKSAPPQRLEDIREVL